MYKALSPSFINNVSIKAFEKMIVDICWDSCLSCTKIKGYRQKAKVTLTLSSLFLARRDACKSHLDTNKNKSKKMQSRNLSSEPSSQSKKTHIYHPYEYVM